jgi:hypothetical protein
MTTLELGPHKRWLKRVDVLVDPGLDLAQPPIEAKVLPSAASVSSSGDSFQ